MAEVGTVDVDDDGLEGQVDDVRVQLVDQLGLKAVGKPRPHAVVAGVAEVEGFIVFKGPVAKEGVVKILFPIAGLGADLERLLRHIQGVVAAQGHLDALGKDGGGGGVRVVGIEELDIRRPRDLAELAVDGVAEGDALRLIQVGAGGKQAVLLVVQLLRVDGQADHREGEIRVQDVAGRHRVGGLQAALEGADAQHRGAGDLHGPGIYGAVFKGRDGAVRRVADFRAFRHVHADLNAALIDRPVVDGGNRAVRGIADFGARRDVHADLHLSLIQAAGQREGGDRRVPFKPGAVGRAGGRGFVIKKTVRFQRTAVGNIRMHGRNIQLVQHAALRITQGDRLSPGLGDAVGGVRAVSIA